MSLFILLLASMSAGALLICVQAFLFWEYKRRTPLVWAQVVFFAAAAVNYAAVTLTTRDDDLRHPFLIITRLLVFGAEAYYLLQYHRRNVDY